MAAATQENDEADTFLVNGDERGIWEEVGVLQYSSGDYYAGELRNELPSGFGVAKYISRSHQGYAGQWIRGKQHGGGILTVDTHHQFAGKQLPECNVGTNSAHNESCLGGWVPRCDTEP